MILTNNLIAQELLTTFVVVKVHHEPNAESLWTLQFENYPPITYLDKYLQTQEKDENLISKKIKAQIHLEVNDRNISRITDPTEQRKSLIYISPGSVIATGIYKDDIKDVDYEGIDSCLDSIFRLKITTDFGKLNLKKGDWVKVRTSESCIDIAREYTPLLIQEKKIEEVKYPKLKHLLGCYFHQDMDLDYTSPDEALKDYVFNAENEHVYSVLNDIENLKKEKLNSDILWIVIGNLGCEYRYNEYTPEEWLDYVSDTIKKYLTEKQKLEDEKLREDNGQKI